MSLMSSTCGVAKKACPAKGVRSHDEEKLGHTSLLGTLGVRMRTASTRDAVNH